MKLLFLGSGPAFGVSPNNYQSNMVLISPSGKKLLIDCGSDIRHSLRAAGMRYSEITDIYISHLHADHVGGLEYLGFTTRFDPACAKPNLFVAASIADDLWNHSLSGGMKIIGGRTCIIDDFFELIRVDDTGSFLWEEATFELVPSVHVAGGTHNMMSYGLFISTGDTKVYLTTDTRFAPKELRACLEQADLIFHDCETSVEETGVHPHYRQLATLPDAIRAKMWLYHYSDTSHLDPPGDGFLGFVSRGQCFDLTRTGNRAPEG